MKTEKQYEEFAAKLCTQAVAAFLALLISVIICILLQSCGSARNTASRQESAQENAAHQRKDTASASAQIHETEADETTEVSNTHTVVYDTSLPVDSTTGRPPIKSETTSSTQKTAKMNKEKQTSTQQEASVTQQSVVQKITESDTKNATVRKETAVPKWIAFAIWGIVALAGIGVVFWTNKQTNWLSALFKKT
nr:MAG TPA: hypothetical protein [Caudoviricetes sp.]